MLTQSYHLPIVKRLIVTHASSDVYFKINLTAMDAEGRIPWLNKIENKNENSFTQNISPPGGCLPYQLWCLHQKTTNI